MINNNINDCDLSDLLKYKQNIVDELDKLDDLIIKRINESKKIIVMVEDGSPNMISNIIKEIKNINGVINVFKEDPKDPFINSLKEIINKDENIEEEDNMRCDICSHENGLPCECGFGGDVEVEGDDEDDDLFTPVHD